MNNFNGRNDSMVYSEDEALVIGLDIGSSYIKAVSLNPDHSIGEMIVQKTGYDYSAVVTSMLSKFKDRKLIVGVTGYGRNQWQGVVQKTEIFALTEAVRFLGIQDGTVIDIGGQDSKVLKIKQGNLAEHVLNRRCAAGTGSYLEFTAHRLNIDIAAMNDMAAHETRIHPLNSYCTVFAGTEIIDCIKKNVPLPMLMRGLYASVAERIREMTTMGSPVWLSGGVIAHHPVLLDVFRMVLGEHIRVDILSNPQFLAAFGIALVARRLNDAPGGENATCQSSKKDSLKTRDPNM